MAPVDLAQARADLQAKMPRPITDYEFASWLMYPKVFTDYMADRMHFGDVERAADPRLLLRAGARRGDHGGSREAAST